LGVLGDARAVETLSQMLADDTDRYVRTAAASALGAIGDSRAVPALIRTLVHHTDENLRSAAASALGSLADPRSATTLIALLESRHSKVAEKPRYDRSGKYRLHDELLCKAAQALGQLNDRRAIKPLLSLLESPSHWVRRQGALALTDVAKRNPLLLKATWQQVCGLVTGPHTDERQHEDGRYHSDKPASDDYKGFGRSSDCHVDSAHWDDISRHTDERSHQDMGIGLPFPEAPRGFSQGDASVLEERTKRAFVVICPACGKRLKVPRQMAGRGGRCPGCSAEIQIPPQPDTESDVKPDF
jgi:hypothetical protein